MSKKYSVDYVCVNFKNDGFSVNIPIDDDYYEALHNRHAHSGSRCFALEKILGKSLRDGKSLFVNSKIDYALPIINVIDDTKNGGQFFNFDSMSVGYFGTAFKEIRKKYKVKPKLEVNKAYRFVYNGGSNPGSTRIVKVIENHDTYIKAEDLMVGEPRNFSKSYISNPVEICL